MNNTINSVPRELLADLLGNDHDKRIMAERHLLAMLANAPSPVAFAATRKQANKYIRARQDPHLYYVRKVMVLPKETTQCLNK